MMTTTTTMRMTSRRLPGLTIVYLYPSRGNGGVYVLREACRRVASMAYEWTGWISMVPAQPSERGQAKQREHLPGLKCTEGVESTAT